MKEYLKKIGNRKYITTKEIVYLGGTTGRNRGIRKMNISKKGINLIKSFEGLRLKAYKCSAGVWTIGYGHTKGVGKHMKIADEVAAIELLKQDLKYFCKAVIEAIKVPINQSMFDALVSFSYNVGVGNLKASTLLKLLNVKDYKRAALQFKRWNKAKGRVLNGLIRRREAETALFMEGM